MKPRVQIGRTALVGAIVSALFSTSDVLAASTTGTDPMTSVYANTVTVRNTTTNDVSKIVFQPNRTFIVSVTRNGSPVHISGLWLMGADNSSVCLSPSPIGDVAIPITTRCLAVGGHTLGDNWTVLDDSNQTLSLTLTASN